jgi:transcription antitermination factor NusG
MTADGNELDMCWYALRTKHQHEKVATVALSNKNFEVFLPLYESVRRWRDRKKLLSLPLFPGYLFLWGTLRRWQEVVTTPGVRGFVQLGSRAAVIPEAEIESVRRVLNGSFHAEPCAFLNSGDWVRVRSGPLSGIEGVLVRKKSAFRLVLSVDMIGRSVSVELDSNIVERIGSSRETGRLPGRTWNLFAPPPNGQGIVLDCPISMAAAESNV